MDNNDYKISVLLPLYKESCYFVKSSVESILNQTFKDFELIIIVDNPNLPKDVHDLINLYKESDNRVDILYNAENVGLALSLNNGLKVARGKYIARMDADDISLNNRLELEYDYCEKNSIDILSTNIAYINYNNEIIRDQLFVSLDPAKTLPYYCSLYHPTLMAKTRILSKYNGYRGLQICEDYELYLRLLQDKSINFGMLNSVLLHYRVRDDSLSRKKMFLTRKSMEFVLDMYRNNKNLTDNNTYLNKYKECLGEVDVLDENKYCCAFELVEKAIHSGGLINMVVMMLKSFVTSPKWTFILLYEKFRNRLVTMYYNKLFIQNVGEL